MLAGVRKLITAFLSAALLATPAVADASLYGLMGKMIAKPGQRDALIAILLEGSGSMPGCRSYIVAKDTKDENAIWVNEVWDSKESHAASLKPRGGR
jgi:quinol monooxygenase YgiN